VRLHGPAARTLFRGDQSDIASPVTGLQAQIRRLKSDATSFEMPAGQSGATQLLLGGSS